QMPIRTEEGSCKLWAENFFDLALVERGDVCCKDKQAVFVPIVEGMETAKYLIPAGIRLERAYRLDDICSGEMYLGAFDSFFKSFRFSTERKHQREGVLRPVLGHAVDGQ